ncbi:MAG TPA: hypothetical protein VMK65_13970 [Longimicrobiales bacterium]|nr:hypothetical protein [Longimicrobiales bacterium]
MQTLALELPGRIMSALEQILIPVGGLFQDEAIRTVARPEIALLFLVLWLLLRRSRSTERVNMTGQGEAILEARHKRGEISKETYERILDRTHEPGK